MTGKKHKKAVEFVVLNSNFEYFCGMRNGGEVVWTSKVECAKPLNHEAKFTTLQRMCPDLELVTYYQNEF